MQRLNFSNINTDEFQPERVTLKEQATTYLRHLILTGQVLPGTKIVEREVADVLNVSRAPARDALMQLEQEGLIISKLDARYVVELTASDINELYVVRSLLETKAVELATININDEAKKENLSLLNAMKDAIRLKDAEKFAEIDLHTHLSIWRQSNNRHLERCLKSMMGPIFMFMSSSTSRYNWDTTLELHDNLTTAINSGDVALSRQSIQSHMQNSLERTLQSYNEQNIEK